MGGSARPSRPRRHYLTRSDSALRVTRSFGFRSQRWRRYTGRTAPSAARYDLVTKLVSEARFKLINPRVPDAKPLEITIALEISIAISLAIAIGSA